MCLPLVPEGRQWIDKTPLSSSFIVHSFTKDGEAELPSWEVVACWREVGVSMMLPNTSTYVTHISSYLPYLTPTISNYIHLPQQQRKAFPTRSSTNVRYSVASSLSLRSLLFRTLTSLQVPTWVTSTPRQL